MAKRKSKKRAKGYLLPKYQDEGRVESRIDNTATSLNLIPDNLLVPLTQQEINQKIQKEQQQAYQESLKQAKIERGKEFVQQSMEDIQDHPLWTLPASLTPLGAEEILTTQALKGAGRLIKPGAQKIKNIVSEIPNPFKFTEESFERYVRPDRNPIARYIDDLRYFPQLQKIKKERRAAFDKFPSARKELDDFQKEFKKELRKDFKKRRVLRELTYDVNRRLEKRSPKDYPLDSSSKSLGTQFAGWLNAKGLLTDDIVQNPSLALNNDKLVDEFIEQYSNSVRGVTLPKDAPLEEIQDALLSTRGGGQHGTGHYQSNSEGILDRFSTPRDSYEVGYQGDIKLNIPGLKDAKTSKEKIDLIKKYVEDFTDDAVTRKKYLRDNPFDNDKIQVYPYGSVGSRERFIPQKFFEENPNTLELKNFTKVDKKANPDIDNLKGAFGLKNARSSDNLFSPIDRKTLDKLKEADPELKSIANKFRDSKTSKQLESLKNMLEFRVNLLSKKFPFTEQEKLLKSNISEIERELALAQVFSESEKKKILDSAVQIGATDLSSPYRYGSTGKRLDDYYNSLYRSEKAAFLTGIPLTAFAGVIGIGAMLPTYSDKLRKKLDLSEEEWNKLSEEEKRTLDYLDQIESAKKRGIDVSNEDYLKRIRERVNRHSYQYGGEIEKAQYSDTIYSGLSDIQKERRKSLLDAADRVVSTQGNDEALSQLLNMTAYMESTLGANPEAYGRSYTRGPMSIDNIAYQDLFSYRPGMKNYTQSQKKYFDWLKNEFGYNYKDMDRILRSDDPVAGMAAARMAYGRVPKALPGLNDKDKMWDYYLSVYNKGGIDKDNPEHRARFDEGWDLLYPKKSLKLPNSDKPEYREGTPIKEIPVEEEDFSFLKYLREKFRDITGFQNGGKIESYQDGTEVLENIYRNYPSLKNLGEVTLNPDTSFTKEKTGIGEIEYFSPTQDSIRYDNYTVAHPKLGTHGIVYNPNTTTEQAIALDMLHGMPSADPKYKKLRNSLKKAILSSKFNEDLKHNWKDHTSEFKENDGKEKFVDNYVDGIIRGLLFEGSEEDFEKAKYSKEANKEYLSDTNISKSFDALKSYVRGYENGGEVLSEQPMQQELPYQEVISYPTEREPAADPRVLRFKSARDSYINLDNTPIPKTLSKKYNVWNNTYKSPKGLPINSYKDIYDIQEFFNSGDWKENFELIEKYRKPSHPMLGEIDPETKVFIPSADNLNTNEEIADYIDINDIPVKFKTVERIPINPDGFAPGSATEFADKVIIPSNNITTKDMQEPILANGEVLMPGEEAQFNAPYVVEEKLTKAQDGLRVDNTRTSMPIDPKFLEEITQEAVAKEEFEKLPEEVKEKIVLQQQINDPEFRNRNKGELHKGLTAKEKVSNFMSDLGTEFAYSPRTLFTLEAPTFEEKLRNRSVRKDDLGEVWWNRLTSIADGATWFMGGELFGAGLGKAGDLAMPYLLRAKEVAKPIGSAMRTNTPKNIDELLALPEEEVLNLTGKKKSTWELFKNSASMPKERVEQELAKALNREESLTGQFTVPQNLVPREIRNAVKEGRKDAINWIESEEWLKRRMKATGESREQAEAMRKTMLEDLKNTTVDFKNIQGKKVSEEGFQYTDQEGNQRIALGFGDDIINKNLRGNAEHEFTHAATTNPRAFEGIKMENIYPEIPSHVDANTRRFLNYLNQNPEKQVRGVRTLQYLKRSGKWDGSSEITDDMVKYLKDNYFEWNSNGMGKDVANLISNIKDKKTLKDFLNNVYTASGIIAGGAAGSAGIKD